MSNQASLPQILDGATGTLLTQLGWETGRPTALANVERPELVEEISRRYAAAGAHWVTANTFAAFLRPDRAAELVARGVELARSGAAGTSGTHAPRVAVSLGPVRGPGERGPLPDLLTSLVDTVASSGADALFFETQVDTRDAQAAVRSAKRRLPSRMSVFVSLAVLPGGKAASGEMLLDCGSMLRDAGADCVGLGCAPPHEMRPVIHAWTREVPPSALLAKPSAGIPDRDRSTPIDRDQFVSECVTLIEEGAGLVGGCCGTNPEWIEALSRTITSLG